MTFIFRIFCFVGLCTTLGAGSLAAAGVSTSNMGDFARVSFAWESPTAMTFSANGTRVTLSFARAVDANVGNVASRLRPYVRGITRTPDGRRVIITLDKPYRVRQFLSGNTNGIDIVTRAETSDETDDDSMSIKPPQDAIKPPILSTKSKPAPVVKTKVAETKSSVYSTKPAPPKPAPAGALSPRDAIAANAANAQGAPQKSTVLTTKPAEPKVAAPVLVKPEPKPPEKPDPGPVSAPKPVTEETTNKVDKKEESPPKPVTSVRTPTNNAPLIIGNVKGEKNPTLEFLFASRVALATFARGNDIWVVFSKVANVNEANLVSALPAGMTHGEAFALPGATAIRLSSTNNLYPLASHVAGTYHWRVAFHKAPQKKSEIGYSVKNTKPASLVFNALDAAQALAFYDPTYGDKFLVMPLFDSQHHLASPRSYAGSDVLFTGQGIAIRTDDDRLKLRRTRDGVELYGDAPFPAQERMPTLPGQKDLGMVSGASAHIVLAYDRFFKNAQTFAESRARIARELAKTNDRTRPIKLHELAGVYITEGFGLEAAKILTDIEKEYPKYYAQERLAIMHAAAYFMADRLPEATETFARATFKPTDSEARLWGQVLGIFAPRSLVPTVTAQNEKKNGDALPDAPQAPKAALDLLSYQDEILQYYPPRIRQKLSIIGADQYIQQKRYVQAINLFDHLSEDGLLAPIQPFAEYMVGRIAAEKGENKRALEIWQKLIERDEDPYITARADFATISLSFADGSLPRGDAIEKLEALRMDWRYDALEQEILRFLGQLYVDNKQYDLALRVWKELLNYYPGTPDSLELTVVMSDLFMQLYTEGLADDLSPLKSLSLFYEFRDLIPVDKRGDIIVRKLAERLANVDLLDRAIALLVHQIKSRSEGLERSKLGTQLALLYIINNQPNEALQTLEASGFGSFSEKIAQLRSQLTAQALQKLGKHSQALQALQSDNSSNATKLRMEIVWDMEDWPNVINAAEDALALREDFAAPLNASEQNFLLRLALAYSFEKNTVQLQYLRDYYLGLIPDDSPNKKVFDYLTNFTKSLSPQDISVIAAQIEGTEMFLSDLKQSLKDGNVSNILEAEQKDKEAKENEAAKPSDEENDTVKEPAAATN